MKKKYVLSALFLLTMSIGALPENSKAASEEENGSGAANVDIDFMENKEYYDELAKQKDLEAAERQKQEQKQGLAAAAPAYYTIPVSYNKQEYSNFCGPAAGRQALSFHKAISKSKEPLPSQEQFGITIGTLKEGNGTSSSNLVKGLNQYKNVYGFSKTPYTTSNFKNSVNPQNTFMVRITDSLKNQKTAPILLTETEWISQYKGQHYRHYVTISGYNEAEKSLRVVDPNHNTEYTETNGTYWTKIGEAKDNTTDGKGIAKAAFKADGANPAMIW